MIKLISVFGAPHIHLKNAKALSDNATEIIAWAAPAMFFFVLPEWLISYRQNRSLYRKTETIASTIAGIGNVVISFLIRFILFCGAILLYNLLPWRMELNWWTLIPCYIILDFCSCWSNRVSHTAGFGWLRRWCITAAKVIISRVSFRLGRVQDIKNIFFIPVALFGFHQNKYNSKK